MKQPHYPSRFYLLCLTVSFLFVGCMPIYRPSEEAKQIIETSLALLDKAPYYSVYVSWEPGYSSWKKGGATYEFIAPDKLRYYAAQDDGFHEAYQWSAIQIGPRSWDKFMWDSWKESTVDTPAPAAAKFIDVTMLGDVTMLDPYDYPDPTNSSRSLSCPRYGFNILDKTGQSSVITCNDSSARCKALETKLSIRQSSVVACIDSLSGLPVTFDLTKGTEKLSLFYRYERPQDITAPMTGEIK